jgi:hypothetical protein
LAWGGYRKAVVRWTTDLGRPTFVGVFTILDPPGLQAAQNGASDTSGPMHGRATPELPALHE